MDKHFVVIGGGIGGIACIETLCCTSPSCQVTLISASSLVKAATNVQQIGRAMEEFSVEEKTVDSVSRQFPNLTIVHGVVASVDTSHHVVKLTNGQELNYSKLCVCTGSIPKMIADSTYVLGIRDTESVQAFQKKLQGASRVIVVGNGGIATELVYELQGCEVIWAIKHQSISAAFFDAGAAQFFLPHLNDPEQARLDEAGSPAERTHFLQRIVYTVDNDSTRLHSDGGASSSIAGSALGPDWAKGFHLKGAMGAAEGGASRSVTVQYGVEVQTLLRAEEFCSLGIDEATGSQHGWPVYLQLTNGKILGADIVVSATGVTPNIGFMLTGNEFQVAEDGGLIVDMEMRTSCADVYAAGDACSASAWRHSALWQQMRLWTQARQMGAYAAKCMLAHSSGCSQPLDFCFELFTHVTEFFGYKVVLLGLFNAQGLQTNEYEVVIRVTKGKEFVKVILKEGRHMVGAILIGDTGLEETFENLILNGTDLEHMAGSLLEPGIDIEDFFD